MQKFCHLFLGGKAGLASEGTSDGVISFRNCINSAERVPTYRHVSQNFQVTVIQSLLFMAELYYPLEIIVLL